MKYKGVRVENGLNYSPCTPSHRRIVASEPPMLPYARSAAPSSPWTCSRGREIHSDTPLYISFATRRTKQTGEGTCEAVNCEDG
jgi:hypothetical protein